MANCREFRAQIGSLAQKLRRRLTAAIVLGAVTTLIMGAAWSSVAALIAPPDYEPQKGDLVFQSLPRNAVVNAIEGATESPYSHCGIVARQENRWVVLEALHGVEVTPLREFLVRGRKQGFAVCRLKEEHQKHVPKTINAAREMLGRPYDSRYRMDDEKIYCSELIWKAYRKVTGTELGKPVQLKTLKWGPYRPVIEALEADPFHWTE